MSLQKGLAVLILIVSGTSAWAQKSGKSISAGGFLVSSAAKIEFFSPGTGIDSDLKSKIVNLIEQYESRGLVQEYTKTGQGMEGEITLCVKLKELDASVKLNKKIQNLVSHGEGKTNLSYVGSCEEKSDVDDMFALKNTDTP